MNPTSCLKSFQRASAHSIYLSITLPLPSYRLFSCLLSLWFVRTGQYCKAWILIKKYLTGRLPIPLCAPVSLQNKPFHCIEVSSKYLHKVTGSYNLTYFLLLTIVKLIVRIKDECSRKGYATTFLVILQQLNAMKGRKTQVPRRTMLPFSIPLSFPHLTET